MTRLAPILEIVSRQFPAAGIDCLLIGGFAVNHYGYTRNTLDVDFMIVSERLEDVRRVLREAGFTNIDVRDNVAFFSRPDGGPRVDFLRVDAATMQRLLEHAATATVQGCALRVPSLRDLLAMKIWSFSQETARRMGKDLPDIAQLALAHNLDFVADLRPLCERFGTPQTTDLIQAQIEALREP